VVINAIQINSDIDVVGGCLQAIIVG